MAKQITAKAAFAAGTKASHNDITKIRHSCGCWKTYRRYITLNEVAEMENQPCAKCLKAQKSTPSTSEPVIVETLTDDDGETVETGYIYQEEDDEQEAEAAVSAITPLQSSLMSFFTAVAMWAVYQEVNAWDVAPADDTAWLHGFQAADEWIAENGHPSGCVCGFCKEVAQTSMEALQAAWDALQAVPAYIERDAHAKVLYARLKAGETLEVAPIANPDNQFSIRPDKWEGLVMGYTVLVDGETVPGNVGMMLDADTVKDWLSGLVERKKDGIVLNMSCKKRSEIMENTMFLLSIGVNDEKTRQTCLKAMGKYEGDHWWEPDVDPRRFAYYQLQEDILLGTFSHFHEAVELLLGRPVFTHEFGINRDGLIQEAQRAWTYQVGVTSEQEKQERIGQSIQMLQEWATKHGKQVIGIQLPEPEKE